MEEDTESNCHSEFLSQKKLNKPPLALTCIVSLTAGMVNATACYPQIKINHRCHGKLKCRFLDIAECQF